MAVSTEAAPEVLELTDPSGESRVLESTPRGGPPWSLEAHIENPLRGAYRVEIRQGGKRLTCRQVFVGGGMVESNSGNAWDLTTEAFFSAWIEMLFDALPEANLSFPSLEPVLSDPERNFLHNHFGRGEDTRLPATPDCADLPYYLRAYFAWKMELPIACRACSRGSSSTPPRCGSPTVEQRFTPQPAPFGTFKGVIRKLVDTVHSGSARTALADESTDFYPVALDRRTLSPGTVYADPYGHVLVIVKWVPQTSSQPGMLLAVDAQPDNSVGRKRFWEGTFLFADDVPSAGAGFKAFRPLVRFGNPVGPIRPLSNAALMADPRFKPFSLEQTALNTEDFYARMGKLINPHGLDPVQAYEAALDALVEQLETRVESVEIGEQYRRRNPAIISMPSGAAIFETIGTWEDYSTPSRDMRLLIAMKVVASFPERIVRYPDLFELGGRTPETVADGIRRLHVQRIEERDITYTRSDGSPWPLTLAEIFGRQAGFEVGYNPNDCVEARWGASPGTEEYAPCQRRAPTDQRSRMERYRSWFHDTRRPPR